MSIQPQVKATDEGRASLLVLLVLHGPLGRLCAWIETSS